MRFQRINREDAEKVFLAVKNVSGGTVTAGYSVVWDVTSPDGVRVSKPATATLSLFAGVANKDIASNEFGEVQAYGYRSQAYVTARATNATVTNGDIIIPVDAQWHLAYSAAGDGKTGFVFAGETIAQSTTPAAGNKKVFLRAL